MAILVSSQTLFMVASITVMTLSGVVGGQLSEDPGLATLPIAMMMLGTVMSTLPVVHETRRPTQGVQVPVSVA